MKGHIAWRICSESWSLPIAALHPPNQAGKAHVKSPLGFGESGFLRAFSKVGGPEDAGLLVCFCLVFWLLEVQRGWEVLLWW